MRLCQKFRHNLIVFCGTCRFSQGYAKKVCIAWLQQTFYLPQGDMPYGVSNGWPFVL